ncbi:MAG: hypothetical protein EAY75_01620 [Bacteroidetes bacterium]|nr:MAG: hypothetical protein EAY75_01620 [Bacteroidota bacterium]
MKGIFLVLIMLTSKHLIAQRNWDWYLHGGPNFHTTTLQSAMMKNGINVALSERKKITGMFFGGIEAVRNLSKNRVFNVGLAIVHKGHFGRNTQYEHINGSSGTNSTKDELVYLITSFSIGKHWTLASGANKWFLRGGLFHGVYIAELMDLATLSRNDAGASINTGLQMKKIRLTIEVQQGVGNISTVKGLIHRTSVAMISAGIKL